MIRAVVFDVGGTLHTSHQSIAMQEDFTKQVLRLLAKAGMVINQSPHEFYESLQERAEEYKAWSEENLRELPGLNIWRDYFLKPYNMDENKLAEIAERLSYLYDACRVRLTPRPHMKETMAKLHLDGLKTGVISNILSLTFVPKILEKYGIAGLMSCVVTSSETGIRKPGTGIFRIAEDILGLKPQELAYVGDTISRDVIGSKNAGWRLMIQIYNPSAAFRDKELVGSHYRPDYLIKELDEIPAIIQKENKA